MFRPARFRPLIWLLITWFPAASARANNLVFQIGLATTQTRTFDINNPITYNFGVTVAGGTANLQGVQFAFYVDRGQNTTAPVVFNLYNGLGGRTGTNATTGTNQSLGITTVSATNYPTAGSNNVFASLTAPILLSAGEYSVQLTTTASGANKTYAWRPGPLQLTSTTGANLNNFLYVEDTDQSGTAGNTLNAANPVLAQPVLSLESVPFNNFRPGAIVSQTVTLTNANLPTANNMSQALASSTTTISANATVSGVPTTAVPLNQGFIATLPLTLTSSTAGPATGSVVMNYLSVQGSSTATGTTAIGTGTIALSGTAWNWASAKVSSGTYAFGNVRTGSAASAQTFAVGNQAVSLASYQDLLNVTGSTNNTHVSVTGFQNLASSTNGTTTSNVSLAANTGTAGNLASTVSLTYTSNANGLAGLSSGTATFVSGSAPTLATTGGVYDYANAVYTGTAMAFGFVHRGGSSVSGTLAIGNQTVTNSSYQDLLNVTGSTGNALVSATGFTGLAATASGTSRGNLVVTAATGTAGALNSTVSLSLVSNANGVSGLSNGTATTVGTPGAVTTTGTVFTGQSTWNTNGGGQWGTLSSNFGTNWNWATFDGSPGVDSGFTNTDTATFAGAVTSGTATVTITAATPSVKALTFNNSAASYLISGSSGGSLALSNTGTNAATVTVSSGSHTIATAMALNSRAAISVASNSLLTASGALSGTNGIQKTGAGALSLTSINSFTGPTTVDAGLLRVNGSIASSSLTTIAAGATLAGSGTVGPTLVYGIHSPGNSPGLQTFTDGLTYGGTAVFEWELSTNSNSAGDRGVTYDGVNVTGGNLQIDAGAEIDLIFTSALSSGSASTVLWSNSFWDVDRQWTAIDYSGNGTSTGLFTIGSVGNDSGGNPLNSVRPTAFFATQRVGEDIVVVYYAPEPGSLAIAALGLGVLGWRVRRRLVKPARARHGDAHAAC